MQFNLTHFVNRFFLKDGFCKLNSVVVFLFLSLVNKMRALIFSLTVFQKKMNEDIYFYHSLALFGCLKVMDWVLLKNLKTMC